MYTKKKNSTTPATSSNAIPLNPTKRVAEQPQETLHPTERSTPATSSNAIPVNPAKRVAEQPDETLHQRKRTALAHPENDSRPVPHHRSPISRSRSQDFRSKERSQEEERLRRKRPASPSPERMQSSDRAQGTGYAVPEREQSATVHSPEKKRRHRTDVNSLRSQFLRVNTANVNAESFAPLLKMLDNTERCYGNLINILLIDAPLCFKCPKKFFFLLDKYVNVDLQSASAPDAGYIGNILHKIGKFSEELLKPADIPMWTQLVTTMFNVLSTLARSPEVEASNLGPALWGIGKFYQWKGKCHAKIDYNSDGLDPEKVAIIFHTHAQLILEKEGNLQNIVNAIVGLRNLAEVPPHSLLTHISSSCIANNFHRIANSPDASAYPISQTLSAMSRFNHFQPGLLDEVSIEDLEMILAKLLENKDKKANSKNMSIALFALSTLAQLRPAFLSKDGDELIILKLLDKILTDSDLNGEDLGYVFSAIKMFAECRPRVLANMRHEKIAGIFSHLFSLSRTVLPSDKIKALRVFEKMLETMPKLLTQISLEEITRLFKEVLNDKKSTPRDLSDTLSIMGALAENTDAACLNTIHSQDIISAFNKVVRLHSSSREIVYALNALGKFSQFKPHLLQGMDRIHIHEGFHQLQEKSAASPHEPSNVIWVLGSLAWLKDFELIDKGLSALIEVLTQSEISSIDIVNALLGLEKISEISLDFLKKVPAELIGKALVKVLNDSNCTLRIRTNLLWTIGRFAETYQLYLTPLSSTDIFLLFSSIINDPALSSDQNTRALSAIGCLAKNIPKLTEKIHARETAKFFTNLVKMLDSTPEHGIHNAFFALGRFVQYQPRLVKYLDSSDINKILTRFFHVLRPHVNHATNVFWVLGKVAQLHPEILEQVDPAIIETALTHYLGRERISSSQIMQLIQPLGWFVENVPTLLEQLSPDVLLGAFRTLLHQNPEPKNLSKCIWVFGKFAPKQDKLTNCQELSPLIESAFSQLVFFKGNQATAQDLVNALYALGKFAEFRVEILQNIRRAGIKLALENLMQFEKLEGKTLSLLIWVMGKFAQHFPPALEEISAELITAVFSRLLESQDTEISNIALAAASLKKLSLVYPTLPADADINQAKRKWIANHQKQWGNKKQESAPRLESSNSSAEAIEKYTQRIQGLHKDPKFIGYLDHYEKNASIFSYAQRKIALAKLAEQLDTDPGENAALADELLEALYCLISKDKCRSLPKPILFFNMLYMLFEKDRHAILIGKPDPERYLLPLPNLSASTEESLPAIVEEEATSHAGLIEDEFVNEERQAFSGLTREMRELQHQETPARLFYRVAILDLRQADGTVHRCSGTDLSVQFIMVEEGKIYFQGHMESYPQLAGFAMLLGTVDPITGRYLPSQVQIIDCRHGLVGANRTLYRVDQPHPIHAILHPLGSYAWHPEYNGYVRRDVVMENDLLRRSSAAFTCCLLGYNLATEILTTYNIVPPSDSELIAYVVGFHLDDFTEELEVNTRFRNIIFNCMDPRLAYYLTCEFFASYIPETMYAKFVDNYDKLTETLNSLSPSKTLDQSVGHLLAYFGPKSPFIAPTYDLRDSRQLTTYMENARTIISKNPATIWAFPVHFVFENEMHILLVQRRSADELSVRWWNPKAKPLSPAIARAISQAFNIPKQRIKLTSQVIDLDTETSFSETAVFLSLIMICGAAATFPKGMDYLLDRLPPEVCKGRDQALVDSRVSAQEIIRGQYRSCVRELDPPLQKEAYENFIKSFDPCSYFESLRNEYVEPFPLARSTSRNAESARAAARPERAQSASARDERSYSNTSRGADRARPNFFPSRHPVASSIASSSASHVASTSRKR